jgi:hypothetical protein
LFKNGNIWEVFSWVNGPHRGGIGFLITKMIAILSGWNTRVECFAIAGTVFLAMIFAFVLKKRLIGSICWTDLAISLMFLTPLQWEIYNTPDLGLAATPLLLVILYCLAWMINSVAYRYSIVLILNFLMIYSGYAWPIAFITPVLFVYSFFKERLGKKLVVWWIALLISLFSIGTFFIGFKFNSGVEETNISIEQFWIMFLKFIALLFGSFFGIKEHSVYALVFGSIIVLLLLMVLIFHCDRLRKSLKKPEL